jgi:hypothetical protein
MVLDIATGLVNDANARQYLNPESNNFSSSATQFAINVAIQRSRSRQDHDPVPLLAFQPQEGSSIS